MVTYQSFYCLFNIYLNNIQYNIIIIMDTNDGKCDPVPFKIQPDFLTSDVDYCSTVARINIDCSQLMTNTIHATTDNDGMFLKQLY